jgi:RNA polymerase sigma factor (sigma-70 family)
MRSDPPMNGPDTAERENLDQLVVSVGQHDRQAFAHLYGRTSARLFGICARVLSDRREAEEVLQELYVTVWLRGASFDPAKGGALAWLVTLARNKAIDRLRQRRDALFDHAAKIDALVDEQPTPASHAEWGQEYQRLQECMEALEPHQRGSVREAFFSGATYSELAVRAKVPLGTMKSWVRRSLLQLRQCLET